MAVLVEAISVIVRIDAIHEKYPGGWENFREAVPNRTLCADGEVARVGFMTPPDAEAFVDDLEKSGLQYLEGGKSVDIVVVDQMMGPVCPCGWAQFGQAHLGDGGNRITVCRMVGSELQQVVLPEGWRYEGSLSRQFTLVPAENLGESMRFLRRHGGVDVYLDLETGEEVYAGRTDRHDETGSDPAAGN
jgi:hypothetical protein